jgi:putative Holliday junction resolvase
MIPKGRVIGLDLGSARIGVAVTDSEQRLATGVDRIQRSGERSVDHAAVARLVEEYEAVGVVVGLPLSMSGADGPAARAVRQEVDELRRVLAVDVDTVDERLTTVTAARDLRAAGRNARDQRGVIDQTAAAVLLQSWVDRRWSEQGAQL